MTIQAKHIPVEQPNVPPCEFWVDAWLTNSGWLMATNTDEKQCDEAIAEGVEYGYQVRKFHCTDQVPEVEKAIDEVIEAHLAEHLSVDDLNLVDDAFRDFARRLGVIE